MRKSKYYKNLPTENVDHIITYVFVREDNGTKIIFSVHLPSKRVSEKHYNELGTLQHYIHSSPDAKQRIEYFCSQDNNLVDRLNAIDKTPQTSQKFVSRLLKTALKCGRYILVGGILFYLVQEILF